MKIAEVSIATYESLSSATRFGQTEQGLWVLDGVPPVSPAYHLNPAGDEVWYINVFDEFLRSVLAEQTPLPTLIEEGIFHVSDVFAQELGETHLDVDFFPAASLAVLRFDFDAETIEYVALGEAGLIIEFDDEVYRVCANDGVVNDSLRDDPDWFLAFAHETVGYARQGTLRLDEVSAVHLFTGDFEACRLDTDPVISWESLLDKMAEQGVEAVLQRLVETRVEKTGEEPKRAGVSSVVFPPRSLT
jgi:hypothetical protein